MAGDVLVPLTMAEALVPLEHHVLALCLCTESNRRVEWSLIGAVIQNRVRSPRFPDTFPEVILQRSQFSAFNLYTAIKNAGKPVEVIHGVVTKRTEAPSAATIYRGLACRQDPLLLAHAIDHAAKMIEADVDGHRISDLITPQTLHYWSPVSLDPKTTHRDAEGFRAPYWWKTATRIYTPEGFDPERFRFAENVP